MIPGAWLAANAATRLTAVPRAASPGSRKPTPRVAKGPGGASGHPSGRARGSPWRGSPVAVRGQIVVPSPGSSRSARKRVVPVGLGSRGRGPSGPDRDSHPREAAPDAHLSSRPLVSPSREDGTASAAGHPALLYHRRAMTRADGEHDRRAGAPSAGSGAARSSTPARASTPAGTSGLTSTASSSWATGSRHGRARRSSTPATGWCSPGSSISTCTCSGGAPLRNRAGSLTAWHRTTTVVDAGSAGRTRSARSAATSSTCRPRVVPSSTSERPGWCRRRGEPEEVRHIDRAAASRTIEAHRDLIRGIKVRLSRDLVGSNARIALETARETGEAAGLPIMIHVGDAFPGGDSGASCGRAT